MSNFTTHLLAGLGIAVLVLVSGCLEGEEVDFGEDKRDYPAKELNKYTMHISMVEVSRFLGVPQYKPISEEFKFALYKGDEYIWTFEGTSKVYDRKNDLLLIEGCYTLYIVPTKGYKYRFRDSETWIPKEGMDKYYKSNLSGYFCTSKPDDYDIVHFRTNNGFAIFIEIIRMKENETEFEENITIMEECISPNYVGGYVDELLDEGCVGKTYLNGSKEIEAILEVWDFGYTECCNDNNFYKEFFYKNFRLHCKNILQRPKNERLYCLRDKTKCILVHDKVCTIIDLRDKNE